MTKKKPTVRFTLALRRLNKAAKAFVGSGSSPRSKIARAYKDAYASFSALKRKALSV